MTLLAQCELWHQQEEYDKIIDALEDISFKERTMEMNIALARAYNNSGALQEDWESSQRMLRRAIDLLGGYEEALAEDYTWHYRLGYSYLFLEQPDRAEIYFHKALALCPEEVAPGAISREDIEELWGYAVMDEDRGSIRYSFKARTALAWEAFETISNNIDEAMPEGERAWTASEEKYWNAVMSSIQSAFKLVFDDVTIEMSVQPECKRIALSPEGNMQRLIELHYFIQHAPKAILDEWQIQIGHQPNKQLELEVGGLSISDEDIRVWINRLDERFIELEIYAEQLTDVFLNIDEDMAHWLMNLAVTKEMGELFIMRYMSAPKLLTAPKEGGYLLKDLTQVLSDMGLDTDIDVESMLNHQFAAYELSPDEKDVLNERMDIVVGSTCCPELIGGYMGGDDEETARLHCDGAVAGFFFYPLDQLMEQGHDSLFSFRENLENNLMETLGQDNIYFIGSATGLHHGYVDFIAWDLPEVIKGAQSFFANTDLPWADFKTFRRDAKIIPIYQKAQ